MQRWIRSRPVIERPALLLCALVLAGLGARAAANPESDGIQIPGTRPQLVFACELDSEKLQALFADPQVIPALQKLDARIALALSDLSPARAQVVRQLNQAGIPVIAWLALPREQGYYLNASNAAAAEERFGEFEKWTAENGLRWVGIGLDIEPSLSEWEEMLRGHRWRLLLTVLRRAFDGKRVVRARIAYTKLIQQMQGRGYIVQTYQLIFLADERRVHSTVLERLVGLVDVRGDDEALMVYSSFNHVLDGALVWAYGPDAQSIAVGSTASSGIAEMDARFPPLNWEEFSRDLIVASHFSHEVGVYSLEGCVRQGFLSKLEALNWEQSVTVSATTVAKARSFRRRVQAILWIVSHAVYIAVVVLIAIGWLLFRWRRRYRRRRLVALRAE